MGAATDQLVSVDVVGDKQLKAALEKLRDSVQRRVVIAGLKKSSKMMVQEIRSRIGRTSKKKRRTGALRNAIGSKLIKYLGQGYALAIIGVRAGEKFSRPDPLRPGKMRIPSMYGHLIEYGTTARRTNKGWDRGTMPAQPFMRPAWDSKKNVLLSVMRREVRKAVAKEIRKARARKAA